MDIEKLKKAKKRLGISYDEIALRSGVPKATVTNVMLGYTQRPRIDTIQKIQQALGVNNGITSEEYEQGARYTKKVSITADEEDILDEAREVLKLHGQKGKDLIINFCKILEIPEQ